MKIDCHHHIFDPRTFPYAEKTHYRPAAQEIGTLETFEALMVSHDIRHSLIVGPNSGYGEDNGYLLHALARTRGRCKGIAVVPPETSSEKLVELKSLGVVGIAINLLFYPVEQFNIWRGLISRLGSLDLFLQLQFRNSDIVHLMPDIESSGVKLLIDHCGHPDIEAGIDAPAFSRLLALGRNAHTVVKLSGYHRFSRERWPYRDTWEFIHALADAFSLRRCVWGSDWPFLRAPERVDYGSIEAVLEHVFPDPANRCQILWDSPCRLFGFSDSAIHQGGAC